jgi:hypothetical protein
MIPHWAVDVLTAIKIRRDIMGCTLPENTYAILPSFGYDSGIYDTIDLIAADPDNLKPPKYNNTSFSTTIGQINPHIDNLHVVCCNNTKIVYNR